MSLTALTSWDSEEYDLVNRLVLQFFVSLNPDWKPRPGSSQLLIDDLPENACIAYQEMMQYAGSAADPIIARRQNLAQLARDKRFLLDLAKRYEETRNKLALPPDPEVTLGRTPLEITAEKTWGQAKCAEPPVTP